MIRSVSRTAGRTVLGSLLLVAGGTALGALAYAWLGADSPWQAMGETPPAVAASAGEGEEGGHEEGVVRIPLEAQRSSGLSVTEAAVRPVRTRLNVTGSVSPDQTRVAHIRPLARGVVEQVFVQLGDRVEEGDPLISYDNIELGLIIGEYLSAKADQASAETNLDVKKTILARSKEMLAVGAIARTTHDVRDAEYRDALAQVDSAKARVAKFEEQLHRFGVSDERLGEVNMDSADGYHRTSSHNVLTAPFSGVITMYDVAVGETVDPSDRLLMLTDVSTVWVLADVYEQDLGAVRAGKEVEVRVSSYPDEVFPGRITYISDLIEPATRTARVRCVVQNPRARLKLDMFATISIPTEERLEVLAVPTAAIQRIDDRPVVYVQRSEAEFEQREVTTGLESEGWVEIRQGIAAGERVVTQGSFYAKTAAQRELIGDEH